MFELTQEWVPSEGEVPETHWSKSPEYLAEKAAREESRNTPLSQPDYTPRNINEAQEASDALYRKMAREDSEQAFHLAGINLFCALRDFVQKRELTGLTDGAEDAVQEIVRRALKS